MAAAAKQRQPEQTTRPLASLKPNPLNPRVSADEDLGELVESIRQVGLLQPLVITPAGLIIAGHRRAKACAIVGLTDVPVIIRDISEADQLSAMLAENVARQALNPLETARACRGLADRGVDVEVIGARAGMGKQKVVTLLAITELPATLQGMIADYSMAVGMAVHLVKVPSDERRIILGLKAVREGWTIVQLASAVNAAIATRTQTGGVRSVPQPSHRAAAPQHAARAPASPAPRAPIALPAGTPRAAAEMLNDLALTVRRQPTLVRDPLVWEAVERLAVACREARARTA
jgi:ParB/RepB/Spo0J family partition protein